MIRAYLLFLCFVLLFSPVLFSQTGSRTTDTSGSSQTPSAAEMAQRLQLALSSPDYRITPGDIFTLAYAMGSTSVEYTVVVDSTYRIRVSNLGVVDATGRTLSQVKSQVETIVSNNYPMSGVQFVLTQPAAFFVQINGEVREARSVAAWALDRLSSILLKQMVIEGLSEYEYLTNFSSIRNVTVRSVGGQARQYDLFRAQRYGDLSHDPYVRPGDVITVNRITRAVTIEGAVERPGTYQLLQGENLKDLIEVYGSGFIPAADKTRLELIRLVNSADISGDMILLSESDLAGNYVLQNYDKVFVPEITKLQPVVFVEGAVTEILEINGIQQQPATVRTLSLEALSNRLVVPFNRGETYASLVRRNSLWFSAVSDTLNAYIIRGDEHIPINLNPMLYDASYRTDLLVEPNDILVIPFRQYYVSVAGAVRNPGRFRYIPDRNWEYYVGLAGGFDTERNTNQSVTITDLTGKQMQKTDPIAPETTITANINYGLYYFNQYAPAINIGLTIILAILSVYAAFK